MIFVSSVLTIFDSDIKLQDHTIKAVATYINLILTVVFIIEFIFKTIVFGFVFNGPDSYLRSGWNIFEFFIVVISILGFCFDFLLDNPNNKYFNLAVAFRVLCYVRVIT